jgi:hypothetical protein
MNEMRKLINLLESANTVTNTQGPDTLKELDAKKLDSYRMKRIAQRNDPNYQDPNWQRTAQNMSKAFYKAKGQRDAEYRKKMNYDPSAEYSDDYGVWKSNRPYEESVGMDEKSSSEKQARFMAACAHDADYASCPPESVAKEFNKADKGTKQLSNAMKEQMNNESDMYEGVSELDKKHAYDRLMQLSNSFVGEDEAFETVSKELQDQGYGPEEIREIMTHLQYELYGGDSEFDMQGTEYNNLPVDEAAGGKIDPDKVKSLMGMPPDVAKQQALEMVMNSTTSESKKSYLSRQINNARDTMGVIKVMYNMILSGEGNAVQGSGYGRKFKEAYDMNNGYHDVDDMDGCDYFPNGADGPVVDKVGPSGARQGDNPEQKKMQVAETHKELVYAYRNFLKESAK